MLRKIRFFYFFIIIVSTTTIKCPKTRKPHPTNCTLFYNCVNLPSGDYVWIPSKCSEGLVFESYLGICALPSESWVCDSNLEVTTIKQNQEEIITSYLDFNSDPFSETLDNSYSLDPVSDEKINSYFLNNEFHLNESFVNNKPEDSADKKLMKQNFLPQFENKKVVNNVIWFGQVVTNLLIYQGIKNIFDETLPNSKYLSESSMNKEPFLLNHFVTNYIFRDNVDTEKQGLNEEIGVTRNKTTLKNPTSEVKLQPVIFNLNHSINNASIIEIKNILGEKEYVTRETYDSLKDQLKLELVNIIPCSSETRLADRNNCTKYYTCETKFATLQEFFCPPYTSFNKETKMCDAKAYSLCKRNEMVPVKIENENPPKKKLCETTGKFPDPNSPSHYYLCYSNNGIIPNLSSIRMMCPKNRIFCAEKKICSRKRLCMKR